MALLANKTKLLRTLCLKTQLTAARPTAPLANKFQVATLKLTYGEKYPYSDNPWDYKNRTFSGIHDIYDRSLARMCENSKVIVIEGNIAAGKNEFAKNLAEQFDLAVFTSPTDDDCFTFDNAFGADLRLFDPCFPEHCQIYDVKKFLQDPNPQRGRAAFLQKEFLRMKHHKYFTALLHLLSTGQGVVIVRTPYGDPVFAEALRNAEFVSKPWKKFYDHLYTNTICDLMTPHLTIYLDVSVETAMNRINARKDKREEGHKNLEKLVGAMDDVYRDGKWLANMGKTGQVMEIDWNEVGDELDIEVIAHEISRLRFECHGVDDPLFQDWSPWYLTENEMAIRRQRYQCRLTAIEYFDHIEPDYDCPEADFSTYDNNNIRAPILAKHPVFTTNPKAIKELGYDATWKFFS